MPLHRGRKKDHNPAAYSTPPCIRKSRARRGLTALPPTRCGYLPAEQRGIVVNLKGDLKAEYGPVSPQPFLRGDEFEECVLGSAF